MSADLIARLKAATGPDRALDNAIAERAGFRPPETGAAGWPLLYTGSVDAARTLLPDQYQNLWTAGIKAPGEAFAELGRYMYFGATPALALCIACLSMRDVLGASR